MSADGPSVAYQGAPGAFSEEAVAACFGGDATAVACREFVDVTRAVTSGAVAYGILPVENSLAGTVTSAYDALAASELEAVAEVVLPIRHFLMGVPGSDTSTLRTALSHPVALAQCTRFLARHAHIRPEAAYDTAGAARDVAGRGDRMCGAIAARSAADRYGLVILAADIQDRPDNATRFLGIGRARAQRQWMPRGHPVRCILLAETANRPGALIELLAPFARRGINLTKLESRPGEEPWTYRFIVELEGTDVGAAVAEAADHVASLRVLGSFHSAAPTALRGYATDAAFS